MDVTLHLGAHRTGTTTLQRFLAANAVRLRADGVYYWGPKKTRSGFFSGLIKAPGRATPEDQRRGRRSCGRIRMELDRVAQKGARRVIVSEENMLGSMEHNLQERALYPDAGARLARFEPGFGASCSRILLTIRSYDRHWASMLSYCVRSGYPIPERRVLDRLVGQSTGWPALIREIALVFPRAELVVSPFEGMVGLPEHQLTTLLGAPLPGPFEAMREWHNAGPDVIALDAYAADLGLSPEKPQEFSER